MKGGASFSFSIAGAERSHRVDRHPPVNARVGEGDGRARFRTNGEIGRRIKLGAGHRRSVICRAAVRRGRRSLALAGRQTRDQEPGRRIFPTTRGVRHRWARDFEAGLPGALVVGAFGFWISAIVGSVAGSGRAPRSPVVRIHSSRARRSVATVAEWAGALATLWRSAGSRRRS